MEKSLEYIKKRIEEGNCYNCLHAEDGSKIGKAGWLNCPK